MKKQSERIMAPDILKITAAIFVVVIHHKRYMNSPYFVARYHLFHWILLFVAVALGVFFFARELSKGNSWLSATKKFMYPLMVWIVFSFFKKFPVAIFIILTSYFLSCTISKQKNPIKNWYTCENLASRTMRFYMPLIPIFVIGIIYKVIVLEYEYSVPEIILRFLLGGFKPGSYYITILVQLVFLIPIVFLLIRKMKFSGVILCTLFTFCYDFLCTQLQMNSVVYKFLIFRFCAHIALGVYGYVTSFRWKSVESLFCLAVGFVYSCAVIYTDIWEPKIFFQWQEASFPVAFYVYPFIAWFVTNFKNVRYSDTKTSKVICDIAGSTYHLFLIQLLYYTTFGFALNEYINDFVISLPLNLLITIPLGVGFFKISSPLENIIISKTRDLLAKSSKA